MYKFVSQPDPSLPDGTRSLEDGQRKDVSDPSNQLKGLVGVSSTCQSKGLPQVPLTVCVHLVQVSVMSLMGRLDPQRSSPSSSHRSSRNDYMKSGLYSTFTIQSLQTPPNSRPIKSELLLQPDPAPKADCLPREVSL